MPPRTYYCLPARSNFKVICPSRGRFLKRGGMSAFIIILATAAASFLLITRVFRFETTYLPWIYSLPERVQLSADRRVMASPVDAIVSLPAVKLARLSDRPTRRLPEKEFNTSTRLLDVLSQKPPRFVSNLTNPCWYAGGEANGNLTCFPYFFIIGFPKCGSSTFYYRIIKHPDILTPCTKEPEFWTHRGYSGSFVRYTKCYRDIAKIYTQRMKEDRPLPKLMTVDSSVSIIWADYRWRELPENSGATDIPLVSNADLVKHVLPDAKFIVLMRNPVDRLYSAYNFFAAYKMPASPEHFHGLVVAAISVVNQCLSENHTIRWCVYNPRVLSIAGSLERTKTYRFTLLVGIYYVYIEKWLTVFPKESVLLLRAEDSNSNKMGELQKTFEFLGIDTKPKTMNVMQKVRSAHRQDYPPMLNETRDMLGEFYRPYNKRLVEITGDRKFLWAD